MRLVLRLRFLDMAFFSSVTMSASLTFFMTSMARFKDAREMIKSLSLMNLTSFF